MKHAKEALKVKRMTVGDDSPLTLETLEVIAKIHMDTREFEDAIKGFENCLSHNSKLQREIGLIYQI